MGLEDAHSTEIAEKTKSPVISIMEEQKKISDYGGTMRLGAYKCQLKPNSKISEAYNKDHISERHRHRYEFNNDYLKEFENKGMMATGINPETGLVEVFELKEPSLVCWSSISSRIQKYSRPTPSPIRSFCKGYSKK